MQTAWLAAVHDFAAAGEPVAKVAATVPVRRYRLGRAMLLGQWEDGVHVVSLGECAAALAGHVLAGSTTVRRAVDRATRLGQWVDLARLPGTFACYVLTPDRLTVAVDVAAVHAAFYTRIGATWVVASRADVLADLAVAPVDDAMLAARLAPGQPVPLLGRSLFAGVDAVPPGHALTIDRDGRLRLSRWWHAPEQSQPLADAGQLRRQLSAAVARSVSGAGTVSCDLSGGLDSTTLAFLTYRHIRGASLRLFTCASIDPDHPDLAWARRVAAYLPESQHIVIGRPEYPPVFADLDLPPPMIDEPDPLLASAARLAYLGQVLASNGGEVHVAGYGADEVIGSGHPVADLAGQLHRHPLKVLARHRGFRTLGSAGMPGLNVLARRPSYRRWLNDSAGWLARSGTRPAPIWGTPVQLPVWATDKARQLVRDLVTAEQEPLAATPARHVRLASLWAAGRARRLRAQACPTTLSVLPFLHREVIEAFLAVRLLDQTSPWRFKPSRCAGSFRRICWSGTARDTTTLMSTRIWHGTYPRSTTCSTTGCWPVGG